MSTHVLVKRLAAIAVASAVTFTAACSDSTSPSSSQDITKLNHIVVIYLENHSFDNLYGQFAGAEGLSSAAAMAHAQIDLTGAVYTTLPQTTTSPFPTTIPNGAFNIDQVVPPSALIPDLVHRYYQEQQQIDGGKMDKFAAVSDAKGEAMGYYFTDRLPMVAEAEKYVL